jgi:prefoldin subunit 5
VTSPFQQQEKPWQFSSIRLVAMARPAQFIADVESYMSGQTFENKIVELQEQLRGYRQREQALLLRKGRLLERLPQIRTALEAVLRLIDQRAAGDDSTALADFELTDGVFARAALRDVAAVNLWLGANVMVEYPLDEARTLLEANLATCKSSLTEIEADMAAVKDSITITEVSVARVFNWDVEQRRQRKAAAVAAGGGGRGDE